jgi:hypothetical protein
MVLPARTHQEDLNSHNIKERTDRQKVEDITCHAIESNVFVKYSQSSYGRGPLTKILPFWKIFMLVEVVDNDKYSLRNIVNGKLIDYHVQLIKPFFYDERFVKPVEVVIAEHDEFHIDEIIEHKFQSGGKNQLVFLVSWLGYQENSWELVSNLRLAEKFYNYAKAHKLVRFIPTNFKTACVAREDAAKDRQRQV